MYIPNEDYNLEGTNAWDGDFSPPRPGSYLLRVAEIKSGTANGKTMITLKAEVVAGENGKPTTEEGKFAFQNYFPTGKDKARERYVAMLDALGFAKGSGFDTDDAAGKLFTATVTNHEYDKVSPDGTVGKGLGTGLVRERKASQSV